MIWKEETNEETDQNLSSTLIAEFPCRPHWTKNTREIFQQSVKNLDPSHLQRFAAVRKQFDPNGTYRSIVGQIIGVM
jgi:L-gulonolactone oxidase